MTIQTNSWLKINSLLDSLINELSRAKDKKVKTTETSQKIQNLANQIIFECKHFTEDLSEFVSWDELQYQEEALQSKITIIERIEEKGSFDDPLEEEALAEVRKVIQIRTERFKEQSRANYAHAVLGRGICYGHSLSVAAQPHPESNLQQARFVQAAYNINNSMLCKGNAQKIGSAIFENPHKYAWILSHAAHVLNYRELSDLLHAYENPQERSSLSTLVGRVALVLPFTQQYHNREEANALSEHMASIEQMIEKTRDTAELKKMKDDLTVCKKKWSILKKEEDKFFSAFAQMKDLYVNANLLEPGGLPGFLFPYLKISPGKTVIAPSPSKELAYRLKELPDKGGRFIVHLRSDRVTEDGYHIGHVIFFSFDPPTFSDPNNLHPIASVPIVEEFSSSDEMLCAMCKYLNSHYFESGRYVSFSVDRHDSTI